MKLDREHPILVLVLELKFFRHSRDFYLTRDLGPLHMMACTKSVMFGVDYWGQSYLVFHISLGYHLDEC